MEKIAALDTTDIKLRVRRFSTYPCKDGGIEQMQSPEDYSKELSLRFLTDKEHKIMFMVD
jgi:hypothetical protein